MSTDSVTITYRSKAVFARQLESEAVEKLQLEVGEQMTQLLFKQVQLSERQRLLGQMIERLMTWQ